MFRSPATVACPALISPSIAIRAPVWVPDGKFQITLGVRLSESFGEYLGPANPAANAASGIAATAIIANATRTVRLVIRAKYSTGATCAIILDNMTNLSHTTPKRGSGKTAVMLIVAVALIAIAVVSLALFFGKQSSPLSCDASKLAASYAQGFRAAREKIFVAYPPAAQEAKTMFGTVRRVDESSLLVQQQSLIIDPVADNISDLRVVRISKSTGIVQMVVNASSALVEEPVPSSDIASGTIVYVVSDADIRNSAAFDASKIIINPNSQRVTQ